MSRDSAKCNGWTNYATWRINLELADDSVQSIADDSSIEPYNDVYDLSQEIQRMCEDAVTQYGELEGLAVDYAMAFMSEVNWYEIAEHAAEDYPQLIAHEEEEPA